MEIRVILRGVSCHGSAPERGVSAAYKAAKAALAIEQLNKDLQPDAEKFLGKGTITVSQMDVRGPSQCAVADYAMLYLDRRLTWGEDAELAMSQVRDYISKATGDCCATDCRRDADVRENRLDQQGLPPGAVLPDLEESMRAIIGESGFRCHHKLFGKAPGVDKWTFSTNLVATTGRHKIPAIGFGPRRGPKPHAPTNEIIRVDDLEICAALYAMLPYSLEA
jgi:putative selenium metabolism hydrolase